ncbi:MAG: TRAP transporter small permease subunit [Pseudomonadota bacterium]
MDNIDPELSFSDPGEMSRHEQNRGDRFIVGTSNLFAFIYPILMVAICSQVVLRGAGYNQAWLDDLQWWLYGAAVLIGIGFAVTTNSHVRVDIFFDNYPRVKKLKTDIFGLSWLFLPFIILCWDVTLHYGISSIKAWEGSDSPNGLHNLWALKVFMNVAFVFVGLAVWFTYTRRMRQLGKTQLWQTLAYAFPAVMYLINLSVYYALYWLVWLTGPEDMAPRAVTRTAAFGELEFWGQEMAYTVLAALIITLAMIATAYVRRDVSKDNQPMPPARNGLGGLPTAQDGPGAMRGPEDMR